MEQELEGQSRESLLPGHRMWFWTVLFPWGLTVLTRGSRASLDSSFLRSPHSLGRLVTAWNVPARQALGQREKNSVTTQSW